MEPTRLNIKGEKLRFYRDAEVPVFPAYLAGKWYFSSKLQDVKSPIDFNVIAKVSYLSQEEIESALSAVASQGKERIRETPGEERIRIFHRAADLITEMAEDFADVLVINNGKTRQAAMGEVNAAVERLRRSDLDIRKIYGDYVPGDWSRESLETEAIVKREPVGVVLAIVPFNYPLFDTVNKTVYSTIAGNAVIVKPPSSTPILSLMFARIMELAGFPKESFAVLPIPGRESTRLVSDRRVNAISLTGSTETGIEVMKVAGIKQLIMELGGGDSALVLRDAELTWAAERISTAITSYSGQRCDSVKLVLVEEPVYEEFKRMLIANLQKVKVGDPREEGVNMGPLIDESTAQELETAVKDAVSKGGKLLYGGRRFNRNYIEPSLVEVPREKISELYLYNKEVFGSVALITSFRDLKEAISISNNRRYGLDAAIFGKDINRIRRLIRLLEVGAVYINDYPRHGIGYFPFGGRKDSGIGREGIGYTIEYVTAYKTVVYNYKGKGVWEYM